MFPELVVYYLFFYILRGLLVQEIRAKVKMVDKNLSHRNKIHKIPRGMRFYASAILFIWNLISSIDPIVTDISKQSEPPRWLALSSDYTLPWKCLFFTKLYRNW